jgi:signal transduction histidine kinase
VGLAVAQFAAAGLATLVLVGVAATLILRQVGTDEAIADAKRLTNLAGHGIVEPRLDDKLLAGDPAALAALDRIVRRRLLIDPIVRVKLWAPDGTVMYSDERRLIGARYPLDPDELADLRRGSGVEADVSDLTRPENRFERSQGKLLEVYLPVQAQNGSRLMFEAYLRFSSVSASARKLWTAFLPALVVALGALWLIQLPLAWRLARSLRRGQEERERLLQHALEASQLERRRIAADLHDGAVQDLAGVGFSLAAEAQRRDADPAERSAALARAAGEVRDTIRQLRALLVDLYPPSLHRAGLAAALTDLAAPLSRHGIEADVSIDADGLDLTRSAEFLLFRTAQEALRNVVRHASATHVAIRVRREGPRAVLEVEDDGTGFEAGRREAAAVNGHLGLELLADLALDAGARLDVESRPGNGTRVRMEVPA